MREGYLKVSSLHTIWFEESGNSNGEPVIYLHGGPGSFSKAKKLNRFDRKIFRVIQFDQRGCGKSIPQGEIEQNTTSDLVEDIEKLRRYLKINKWIVSGGSWGSTLALVYAEKYPEHVCGLFLYSIFLAREADDQWQLQGARQFYPDIYSYTDKILQQLNLPTDKTNRDYLDVIQNGTSKQKKLLVSAIKLRDDCLLNFSPMGPRPKLADITSSLVDGTKILLHYESNGYFVEEDQIIRDINKLKNIPITIVHARYDMCCVPQTAFYLHRAAPWSKLYFLEMEGHRFANKRKYALYLKALLRDFAIN
jgi:proline iminopeptidase